MTPSDDSQITETTSRPDERGSSEDGESLGPPRTRRSGVLSWQGPLPPPPALGGYDDVVENGAERVFQQFEAEGAHRREMERVTLVAQARDLLISKILAFIFLMAMIVLAAYAISEGYPVLGGILGTSAIASIVGAFIYANVDTSYDPSQRQ